MPEIIKLDPSHADFEAHARGAWDVLQEVYKGSFPLLELQRPEHVAKQIRDGKLSVYAVLNDQRKVIGTGSVIYSKRKDGKLEAELGRTALLESARKSGTGRELVKIRLAEARGNKKVKSIYSTVRASEPATVKNIVMVGGLKPLGLLPLNFALDQQQQLIFCRESKGKPKREAVLLAEEHAAFQALKPPGVKVRVVEYNKASFHQLKGRVEFHSPTARCTKIRLGQGKEYLDHLLERLESKRQTHLAFVEVPALVGTIVARRELLRKGFTPTVFDPYGENPTVTYGKMIAPVEVSPLRFPQGFRGSHANALRIIHSAHKETALKRRMGDWYSGTPRH